ncbi:MAG: DUF4242 domain-containing protein [Marinicella sp.]
MKKFIIERHIPNIGTFDQNALAAASGQSCDALKQIGPQVQWVESFVTKNKTFCIYLAEDEKLIQQHAEISGFPANKITEVSSMISPMTAS